MSIQAQRTRQRRVEDQSCTKTVHSLCNAHGPAEVEHNLTNWLDDICGFFGELTGEECRATLELANAFGFGCYQLHDRGSLKKLGEPRQDRITGRASTNCPSAGISSNIATSLWSDALPRISHDDFNPRWANPRTKHLAAPVRAPMTMLDCSSDVIGSLHIENSKMGFDRISEKALAAFAYEMYFALSMAKEQPSEFDYIEPLSLK